MMVNNVTNINNPCNHLSPQLTIKWIYVRVSICLLSGHMTGKGDSVGTSVRDRESQEGACESLKGLIALAIDVLV